MAHAMTPSFGARFEMLRHSVDDQGAVYAVTIYLPTETPTYMLHIASQDGACQLRSPGCEPVAVLPAWVHKHLLALARQLFRAAQRDGTWLRRLMRWHEDPQATESRVQYLTQHSAAEAASDAARDSSESAREPRVADTPA